MFLILFGCFLTSGYSFALLGPFADWMDQTNGFRQFGDIGGPMALGRGYRWNVPVVTYGFDQTFIDYFGSNGVYAVESAINTLNQLPPASQLELTNFPLDSVRRNQPAEANFLFDLKSTALAVLLEQMGLAQPVRYIFGVMRWDPAIAYTNRSASFYDVTEIPDYIVARNFDPETLQPSNSVNNNPYSGLVYWWGPSPNAPPTSVQILMYPVDGYEPVTTAVADNVMLGYSGVSIFGLFYGSLTKDDAGGLRYLLATNNLVYETLLSDVHVTATNSTPLVNLALRPGVDKVGFIRHPFDARLGQFSAFTNQFADTYVSNGVVLNQMVQREMSQPDFLFCAGDNGAGSTGTPLFTRTGTTNWLNNAELNGNTNQPGPGVITPQIRITFHKQGPLLLTTDASMQTSPEPLSWGSFDFSTNPPITYPASTLPTNSPLTIGLRLAVSGFITPRYDWHLPVPLGASVLLQASTNLVQWDPLGTVTNTGAVVEWMHYWARGSVPQPQRFFRVAPQNP